MIVLTENGASLTSPTGIKLNALSPDTLKYLGGQVGKIIEAKVVQVVSDLASTTNADKASPKHIQNNNLPTNNSAQSTQLNNPKSEIANPNLNISRREASFQVFLEVGTQRISVKSPLAPRIGQLLQLEVINFKTLSIVEANPSAHAATARTPTRLDSSTPLTPLTPQTTTTAKQQQILNNTLGKQIALVQKALRQSLPKQLSRSELRLALDSLAKQLPSSAAANIRAAITQPTAPNNTQTPLTATTNQLAANQTTADKIPTHSTTPNAASLKLNNKTTPPMPSPTTYAKLSTTGTTGNLSQNTTTTIPASIKFPLQQFKDSIPALEQLTKPNGIKHAFLNSGLFFEKKLTQLLPQAPTVIQQPTKNRSHPIPNEFDKTAKLNTPINKAEANKQLKGDLKYQLASVAEAIKSHLAKSTTSSSTTNHGRQLSETLPQHLQPNSTLALLWQLENSSSVQRSKNTNAEADSNDTIMQLLRLALGGLARTQSQQLQSLGSQLAANSDTVSNQLLSAELPFWHNAQLNIIDIKIDREKTDKQKTDKPNAWNVRLRFDLEELGELTALATLQGKTMAAVFWASDKTLADKIGRELDQLSQNLIELGLEVKQLHCSLGEPDGQSNDLPVNLLNTNLLQAKT